MVSKKSTSNKAKAANSTNVEIPAQPIGESAPLTLTTDETLLIEAIRRGQAIQEARRAEREARIDERCTALKALDNEQDIDKALDFLDRITGKGGQYLSPVSSEDEPDDYSHMFWQMSLHLALAFIRSWIGVEGLFEGTATPEQDEAYNLAEFVPWINKQIWAGIEDGLLDENAVLNWINSPAAMRHSSYHAEWIDKRGIPVWMGRDSLKLRLESHAAMVGQDE